MTRVRSLRYMKNAKHKNQSLYFAKKHWDQVIASGEKLDVQEPITALYEKYHA